MLEQRQFTRFFANNEVTVSPIEVRFFDYSGAPTVPNKTQSSNLSFFATSSVPYIDGVATNRGKVSKVDVQLDPILVM